MEMIFIYIAIGAASCLVLSSEKFIGIEKFIATLFLWPIIVLVLGIKGLISFFKE